MCMPLPCSVPEEAPPQVVELMDDCMLDEPTVRPTAKDVINRLQAVVGQYE